MRILFIGDIVGSIGRTAVTKYLPKIKEKYQPHLIIVNGENAAHGKGITEKIYNEFLSLGVHAVTLGNHTWDNREIFDFIDGAKYLVRPANFPKGVPGQGICYVKWNQIELAVINLIGRTFMNPCDDPFQLATQLVDEVRKRTPFIFVDIHAEATSEKQAIGWLLDGRVSAVVGTHTHVQTADNRILPKGTAYMSDVGMCGAYDSILGTDKEMVLKRFMTQLPQRFEVPSSGRDILSGVLIELDQKSGLAKSIERILVNEDQSLI